VCSLATSATDSNRPPRLYRGPVARYRAHEAHGPAGTKSKQARGGYAPGPLFALHLRNNIAPGCQRCLWPFRAVKKRPENGNRHGCGSAAIHRRSRCGSLRGWPVLSWHFSPGWAPQVGQVTARTCSGLSSVFMAKGQYPKPVTGVGPLAHRALRQ
jgi:hypothetical protein